MLSRRIQNGKELFQRPKRYVIDECWLPVGSMAVDGNAAVAFERSRFCTYQCNYVCEYYVQPKPKVSKYDESKGVQKVVDEGPLDDPVAEKLRQQRLVEEADYAATMELFGSSRDLDGFIPKSSAEFEELGKLIAAKYLLPHAQAKASNYKAAIKSLLHAALHGMAAADVKDVETCVSGIRSERLKAEKVVNAGKKTLKKATLNVGKGGGSAGLDDYVYDDPLEDDFDFM